MGVGQKGSSVRMLTCTKRKIGYAECGFTLLETLVYLGLLTVIISGCLTLSQRLLAYAETAQDTAFFDQSLEFVRAKLEWYVKSSSDVKVLDGKEVQFIIPTGNINLSLNLVQKHLEVLSGGSRFSLFPESFQVMASPGTAFEIDNLGLKVNFFVNHLNKQREIGWIFLY